MTRIACIPDLHCWENTYTHPTPDGVPFRLKDWRTTADALVELVIRERIEIVLAPGDLYPTAKPNDQARLEVFNLFRRLTDAGATVVATRGNHDDPGPGVPGPVDELALVSGNLLWGITTPRIVEVQGMQVAVLPWAKPANLLQGSDSAGDLVGRTSAVLLHIVRGLAAQLDPSKPAVLMGHWAISGCMTSSGMVMVGNEPALTVGDLQSLPFKLSAMGHIHKPQIFPGHPHVLHTGAFQRRDFGEERDARGVYIWDSEMDALTWHDLPCREFKTYAATLDVPADVDQLYERVMDGEAAGRIVRVKYRATTEIAKLVDHRRLLDLLQESGPEHIAGIYPEVIRADRARAQDLCGTSTPDEQLEAWLQQTGHTEDLKADVRAAFQGVYKEVG